jgi:hypothetical protein
MLEEVALPAKPTAVRVDYPYQHQRVIESGAQRLANIEKL